MLEGEIYSAIALVGHKRGQIPTGDKKKQPGKEGGV